MCKKNLLWVFVNLLITCSIIMAACAPVATEPSGPVEEPVPPVEPTATNEEPVPELEFPPPIEGEFECTQNSNMVCIIGENEDVSVTIPEQEAYSAFLYAVSLPVGNLEELKSGNDEFTPHRLVINLECVLDPNSPEEYIREFNPPIELFVRYTEADVIAAGGLENLQLGYWDEENERWVSFANREKYEFGIEGDESGGYFWVKILKWGDRHIGFG